MSMINPPSDSWGVNSSFLQWLNKAYVLLFALQESGVTDNRPTKNLFIGRPYFDTTLGYMIHYNGSSWVDSSGATV